jgi:hypothetical protein
MSSKSNEDGLAAARSRLRPVHGLAVEDAASKETQDSTRVVGDSTAAVAETGTMTDDVDVVDKNAFETVPVSLDAFLRVLVDGLVDEAVRAHEAAEACGPLVSSTPTALATEEDEGVSKGASEADREDRGEDREEDARENVTRRVEDEPARLEPRGFSPEHAAAVDAVTADAADAVGVAVRGLLGCGDSPTTRASARGTTLLLRDRRRDDETSPISRRRSARFGSTRCEVAARSTRTSTTTIRESDFGTEWVFEDDSSRFVRVATPPLASCRVRSRAGHDDVERGDSRRRGRRRGVFVHRGVRGRREQSGGVVRVAAWVLTRYGHPVIFRYYFQSS